MKAKRLLESSEYSNDGKSQTIFCETHPQEEIERICSLNNCKKKPLLCWQCLLDDKEHSDSHRQHFLKLPDFLKKFIDEYEELNNKLKSQDLPTDLNNILNEEEKNIDDYESLCESQKGQIEEELLNLQKEVEKFCSKTIENLKEGIDKKLTYYKQNYALLKTKIEEYYGLSKMLTKQQILDELYMQKENSLLSSYFLNLKQSLLPKIPLLKDPGFTTLLNKLSKMNEKTPSIEEFSKIRKIRAEALKIFDKNLQDIQNELIGHFKLDRSTEDNFSSILKKNIQNISINSQLQMTQQIGNDAFIPMNQPSEAKKISLDFKKVIKTSHTKQINAIKVINEDLIATGSKDKKIKIWKMYTKECVCTLEGHKDNVCCLGTLNQPKNFPFLISGGGNFDSTLIIWDLEARKARNILLGHQSSVTTVVSLNDAKTVISGSYDNNIIIWDIQEVKAKFVLRKHSAMVSSLQVLKEGTMFASGSWDKTVALWRIVYDENHNFSRCDFMYSILENFAILTLASPIMDPTKLIYAGTNKKFYLYNVENKEKEKEFEGSHFGVNELVVVESSFHDILENFMIIGLSNNDSCVRMWEGKNCEEVFCLKDSENVWINNMNTGPKIEIFNNFENKIQIALLNSSETNFCVNIYDLKTDG